MLQSATAAVTSERQTSWQEASCYKKDAYSMGEKHKTGSILGAYA